MPTRQDSDKIVFILRRETQCGRCQCELGKGDFICLAGGEAMCLKCADLAHLEYLPAGDTAVTQRATKYSNLHVVVMKKSAARKRSERQGILVDAEAIRRAEAESGIRYIGPIEKKSSICNRPAKSATACHWSPRS